VGGLAALLLAASGCGGRAREEAQREQADQLAAVTKGTEMLRRDVEALRQEIATLRAQFDQARTETAATSRAALAAQLSALDALSGRVSGNERRLEDLAGTLAGAETPVDGLADQVARLEAVSAPVPRSRLAPRSKGARTPSTPVGPEELFDRAMESFRAGELGQAVLDFEEFVGKNPKHPLVASAEFWVGEAYFRARDFDNAAAAYQRTVGLAPKGERTSDALLRLGLALRALKREERAREAWSRLVRDFPDSEAAKRGKVLLRESSRPPRPPGADPPKASP
jgi:tol-pal system protein YbgF